MGAKLCNRPYAWFSPLDALVEVTHVTHVHYTACKAVNYRVILTQLVTF